MSHKARMTFTGQACLTKVNSFLFCMIMTNPWSILGNIHVQSSLTIHLVIHVACSAGTILEWNA